MKSLLNSIKNFFWPAESAIRIRRAELTFWAFILALGYLPIHIGFVAWIALARPFMIVSRLSGREAFNAAYFFAFMANLFQLYWVAVVTPPGMVAAVVILSLYPALVLLAFSKVYHWKKWIGLAILPSLWVGMEYARSLSQFAFPWTDLAYSMGYYLTFIQIASVIGCYGISFVIILFNIFTWQVFEPGNRLETRVTSGIAFLGIAVFMFVYGWVVFEPYPEEGKIRIAMLQGNIPLGTKWKPETRMYNFDLYDSLTAEAVKNDTLDLIVWPETAAPAYPQHERRYRFRLQNTARQSGTKHLVGALDVEYEGSKEKAYNAAFQFDSSGAIDGIYHKVKLVPFSEHVPYQDHLTFLTRDFLAKYLDAIETREVQWWSDFYTGDSIVLFNVDYHWYAVLICFESAFPDFCRQAILEGAEFLVNITNDTWFGYSPGPFQHMRLAVFRAVENRSWVVRCANSGISAFIDPFGREFDRGELYARGIHKHNIYPVKDYTFFTRNGPIIGKISALIMASVFVILILLWLFGKTSKRKSAR